LNEYIENESFKDSYVITPEHYGTVDDYMEILIQYTMLTLFGATFPMSYFLAFIWNVFELHTDKYKLIHYTQRPLPLSENSIGVWNNVMDLLSLWGVL
jgi:Calcium-activated chloride channel